MEKLLAFVICIKYQFFLSVFLAFFTHLNGEPISLNGKARIQAFTNCLVNKGNFSDQTYENQV